jgi:hypothetical protein
MKKKHIVILLAAVLTVCISCRKFVEVDPPKTEVVLSEAFKEDGSATSAVLGIYINMLSDNNLINSGTTIYSGLSADELQAFSNDPVQLQFQQNKLLPTNATITSMWSAAYTNLVLINTCIEGLTQSTTLSAGVRQQLLGECKFNRAFINFYLVNLWGNVPLVTTSDYKANAVIGQSDKEAVYTAIFNDLKEAQAQLAESYPTTGRVRPNKFTATALLARAYLYHKDYSDAETQASAVIGSGMYGPLPELNSAFLKDSPEAIWQLMSSSNLVLSTQEGYAFIGDIPSGYAPNYILNTSLLNSFETGDGRKQAWIGTVDYQGQTYYYPFKYKDHGTYGVAPAEYYIMFRLAEQYLIRAEARAQLGKLPGAVADVNVIRERAGLPPLQDGTGQDGLLTAIENENRHEFFTEWGHRWMDLKRTGRADAVLSVEKTGWKPAAALFPVPQDQINLDKKLMQNPGY